MPKAMKNIAVGAMCASVGVQAMQQQLREADETALNALANNVLFNMEQLAQEDKVFLDKWVAAEGNDEQLRALENEEVEKRRKLKEKLRILEAKRICEKQAPTDEGGKPMSQQAVLDRLAVQDAEESRYWEAGVLLDALPAEVFGAEGVSGKAGEASSAGKKKEHRQYTKQELKFREDLKDLQELFGKRADDESGPARDLAKQPLDRREATLFRGKVLDIALNQMDYILPGVGGKMTDAVKNNQMDLWGGLDKVVRASQLLQGDGPPGKDVEELLNAASVDMERLDSRIGLTEDDLRECVTRPGFFVPRDNETPKGSPAPSQANTAASSRDVSPHGAERVGGNKGLDMAALNEKLGPLSGQ